jgi:hypothetical protein
LDGRELSTLHRVLAFPPDDARPHAPRRLGHLALTIVAVAAVAMTIAILALVFSSGHQPARRPQPSGIAASPGRLQLVPDPGAAARRDVAAGIRTFLTTLYEKAFVTTAAAGPSPSPDPLHGLFTPAADNALAAHPDVFNSGAGVTLRNGTLDFEGVVSMNGSRPVQAFLTVTFTGPGALRGAPIVVSQHGRVLLVASEQGWLVSGFAVNVQADNVEPSPSSTHRART